MSYYHYYSNPPMDLSSIHDEETKSILLATQELCYHYLNESIAEFKRCILNLLESSLQAHPIPGNSSHSAAELATGSFNGVTWLILIVFPLITTGVFTTNFVLFLAILKVRRRHRTFVNFFLMNLTLTDMLIALVAIAPTMDQLMDLSSTSGVNKINCLMNHFIHLLLVMVSILIHLVIATERYMVLLKPLLLRRLMLRSHYRHVYILIAVWLIAFCIALPNAFIKTWFANGQHQFFMCLDTANFNKHLYQMAVFLLSYLIPLSILGVIYSRICYRLWKSAAHTTVMSVYRFYPGQSSSVSERENTSYVMQQQQQHQQQHHVESSPPLLASNLQMCNERVLRERRQLTRLLILSVLCFAIFHLPRHVWLFLVFYKKVRQPFTYLIVPPVVYSLSYAIALVNPLLCLLLSKSFRAALRVQSN